VDVVIVISWVTVPILADVMNFMNVIRYGVYYKKKNEKNKLGIWCLKQVSKIFYWYKY
jgi:hypothetical protein